MSRVPQVLFLTLCCALFVSGCGSVPRAFDQQQRADILMRFYSWDDFQLVRPAHLVNEVVKVTLEDGRVVEQIRTVPVSREGFVADLRAYTGRRNLAVIVLDHRLAAEHAAREAAIADLENIYKHFGFQHVSFQQDMDVITADGLPILREY